MDIREAQEGTAVVLFLSGRLDTLTAPVLEVYWTDHVADAARVILDFDKVSYVSSAGLRVLLSLHKKMRARGGLAVRHVSAEVLEVFEMTGFVDVLNIEH